MMTNDNNDTNHSELSSMSYCADNESSQHEETRAVHYRHGQLVATFDNVNEEDKDLVEDMMLLDDDIHGNEHEHEHGHGHGHGHDILVDDECLSKGIMFETEQMLPISSTVMHDYHTMQYKQQEQDDNDDDDDDENDNDDVSSSERTPILSNHANSSIHEYLSMSSSPLTEEKRPLSSNVGGGGGGGNSQGSIHNNGMDASWRTSIKGLDGPPPSPPPSLPITTIPNAKTSLLKHPPLPTTQNKQPKKTTRGKGDAITKNRSTRGQTYIPKKLMRRTKSISEKVLDHKGRRQPTLCRDTSFAIVYLAQLIAVICAGLRFGPDAFGQDGSSSHDGEKTIVSIDEFGMPIKETSVDSGQDIEFCYMNTLLVTLATGVAAMGLSLAVMSFMAVFTKHLVHMALFLAICLSIIWTIVGMIKSRDQSFVPLTGVFALGATVVYTFMVWEKIPFVYANLFTALAAIRNTFAIVGLAVVMQVVALVWIIFYFFTIIGTYDYLHRNGGDDHLKTWNVAVYAGLGISFYWTIQALSHIIQVCIAGYIQKWWFSSRLDHSEKLYAIGESLIRALVYSLGSVCFGSLFIGFVNFLRSITDHIRPNTEEAPLRALVAVQEFLVSCIDYVALVFHNFAMVYVGMYGYDYLQAADKANILFFKRGWQDIVDHSLLSNLLWVVSLMIAGLCGCISMEIEHVWKFSLVNVDEPSTLSFCIGFFVGFILSNILFSVIRSSVNTVVVCFAGSPTEFQTYHPECSQIMRKAWKESWPGFVDFVEKDDVLIRPRSPSRRNLRRNLYI